MIPHVYLDLQKRMNNARNGKHMREYLRHFPCFIFKNTIEYLKQK